MLSWIVNHAIIVISPPRANIWENWLTEETDDVNNAIENKRITHAFWLGKKPIQSRCLLLLMLASLKKLDLHCINIVIYYEILCPIFDWITWRQQMGFVWKPQSEIDAIASLYWFEKPAMRILPSNRPVDWITYCLIYIVTEQTTIKSNISKCLHATYAWHLHFKSTRNGKFSSIV